MALARALSPDIGSVAAAFGAKRDFLALTTASAIYYEKILRLAQSIYFTDLRLTGHKWFSVSFCHTLRPPISALSFYLDILELLSSSALGDQNAYELDHC